MYLLTCINIYIHIYGLIMYIFILQNKGCVWTPEELWDEWTDIRCNDGHQLMDR